MSQYREGTTAWPYSMAITVDCRSWVSGAIDVEVAVPTDLDHFWTTIHQTDGRDIRVLDADGRTKLAYALTDTSNNAVDATDITNREMKLRIDGWTPPAAAMCRLELVWGAAGVSSGGTAVTISGAYSGYIAVAVPSRGWIGRSERPGATHPDAEFLKGSADSRRLFVDFGRLLGVRAQRHANTSAYEQLAYASYVCNKAGSPQAGMIDASSLRFVGRGVVTFLSKSGTDGDDHTLVVTAGSSTSEIHTARAVLRVRDLQE